MTNLPRGRRFDFTSFPEATPPFVLWTIPHACALRELSDLHDVQATERLLRATRCVSDAIATDRVRDDLVFTPQERSAAPLGFSISSALEPLGGLSFIQKQCRDCPANALQTSEPSALAGCVGFIVPSEESSFHEWINAFLKPLRGEDGLALTHRSEWHRLWLQREIQPTELQVHRQIFEALAAHANYSQLPGVVDYLAAVRQAIQHHLILVVRAFPSGRCEGRRWHIPAHCGTCTAQWPDANRQHCSQCGQQGGRQADRTRRRMGIRPYRSLTEFMSEAEIADMNLNVERPILSLIPPIDSSSLNENLPNQE